MKHSHWTKTLMVILALTVALLALAACATPTSAPTAPTSAPAASSKTEPTKPAAPKGNVTLRWFMRWDKVRLDGVAAPVIEAFQKQNPNIKVEIENISSGTEYWIKLQTMIAGATAPDVIYPATHNAYALASKGALMTLDDLAARDKIDLKKYDQSILNLYKYNGKVYCLPIDTAAVGVFYNKDMFDKAGIAYPKEGWSWDEFLATAQKLTKDTNSDGKVDQFGVDVWTSYWPVIVWSKTGHGIFDDIRKPTKMLIEDQESIDALQFLGDLTNKHKVMPSTAERANITDMFLAGKAGMNIIGHWRVPQYQTIKDFKWDLAPLPKGKVQANRSDGSCFGISAQSKNPEAAWEFIKFLAGPDSMGVGLLLDLQQMTPSLVDFQNSDRFLKPASLTINKKAFLAGKENLFTMYDPIHPIYDEIATAQSAELGELWNGNATAKDALARMSPKIKEILQKAK
ncbi:MAG: sugar ABC transporter substrate-binding protein [Chloroflexi bacterium]|nr:sugar ABC transporter substrate-binding protein [Chloroflexota bacterium]